MEGGTCVSYNQSNYDAVSQPVILDDQCLQTKFNERHLIITSKQNVCCTKANHTELHFQSSQTLCSYLDQQRQNIKQVLFTNVLNANKTFYISFRPMCKTHYMIPDTIFCECYSLSHVIQRHFRGGSPFQEHQDTVSTIKLGNDLSFCRDDFFQAGQKQRYYPGLVGRLSPFPPHFSKGKEELKIALGRHSIEQTVSHAHEPFGSDFQNHAKMYLMQNE